MATFSQLGLVSKEADFQNRVQYALFVAAVNVSSEDPNTLGHSQRITYANRVLNGNVNLPSVCNMVLTNPSIAQEAVPTASGQASTDNSIPDGDIQFTVNSLWNALSGVGVK